jgi:hypothetical protein
LLTVAGNILVVAILAAGAVGVAVAAFAIFGTAVFQSL